MEARDVDNKKTPADSAVGKATESNASLPDAAIEGCAGGGISIEEGPNGLPIFSETTS